MRAELANVLGPDDTSSERYGDASTGVPREGATRRTGWSSTVATDSDGVTTTQAGSASVIMVESLSTPVIVKRAESRHGEHEHDRCWCLLPHRL